MLDQVAHGPQLLVGSSMGGWLMLLAALARPTRIVGLLGIASAPDFTRYMRDERFNERQRQDLAAQGFVDLPSHYPGESSYRIEAQFISDAEQQCVLGGNINIDVPVRLIHGQADADVPWQRSLAVAECLSSEDVELILVKDGDHRLSRPEDIRRLLSVLEAMLESRTE